MNRRMRFTLAMVPVKLRARRLAIAMLDRTANRIEIWCADAIDKLNIDKCRRFDNAVTFSDFIRDAELFMFDDDEEGDWM